jgi:hypothetical protein
MNALDPIRNELRAALPARCFLRRDRSGVALFVSDLTRVEEHPASILAPIIDLGYEVTVAGSICRLDMTINRYAALIAGLPSRALPPPDDGSFPLWALAGRLLRAHTPPDEQPIEPIRLTLLRLDAGEAARLARELPPVLAALQRRHIPLPTGAGQLLCIYLWDHGMEG